MTSRTPRPLPRFASVTVLAPVLLVITLAAVVRPAPDGATPATDLAVCVLLIAVIGVPHGALDHLVVGAPARRRLVLTYLAAIGAVLAAWAIAPALALGWFLVASVRHFGQSDLLLVHVPGPRRRVAAWAWGTFVVGVPSVAHLDRLGRIVEPLTGIDPAAWLTSGQRTAMVALILATTAASLAALRTVEPRSSALTALWASAPVLAFGFVRMDPLVSFSLYFALWHSLHHLSTLADELGGDGRLDGRALALAALPMTAASLAGAGAFVLLAPGSVDVIAVTLIGLSALTLPHAGVVRSMGRRRDRSRPAAPASGISLVRG